MTISSRAAARRVRFVFEAVEGRVAAQNELAYEEAASVPAQPPPSPPMKGHTMTEFENEMQALINRHSLENESDTPDFILAQFLNESLTAFNAATRHRTAWYGHDESISGSDTRAAAPEPNYGLTPLPEET